MQNEIVLCQFSFFGGDMPISSVIAILFVAQNTFLIASNYHQMDMNFNESVANTDHSKQKHAYCNEVNMPF